MENGKVKWYNAIKTSDGDLQENQSVEFETEKGDKGLFAVNVKSTD